MKMPEGHTPGPWVVSRQGTGTFAVGREDRQVTRVRAHGGPDSLKVAEADARLIAAAPDLLRRARLAEARLAAVKNEISEGTADGCDCDLGQPCPWHRVEGAILAVVRVPREEGT